MVRLVVALVIALGVRTSAASIRGGEGNTPLNDPGWPAGAAGLFNHPGRVAWWEGPPYGGGQWHAECRGTAEDLSAVLADFAKIDAKIKRVFVHDGAGKSFWLNPNDEPEKRAAARIDWSFTVWQPESWARLRGLPSDLNPTAAADEAPPARIDVYVGRLDWSKVAVPEGLEVVDERLEAHGYTAADGVVLEGAATDLATRRPLGGASVRLEKVAPRETGGYDHPLLEETRADERGRWAFKGVPAAWVRVVVSAEGYAGRVAGYYRFDGQPRWLAVDGCGLAPSARVSGRVVDEAGAGLAGVEVRLANVGPEGAGRYETPAELVGTTDEDGRFAIEGAPAGRATVWVRKEGYVRPGLGPDVETPADGVALAMQRAASLRVGVDFSGKLRPGQYLVELEPEGGHVVGSFGGSGAIDEKNQIRFENVPAGRYMLKGYPNPHGLEEETDPVVVELEGGRENEATLRAK